MGIQLDELKDLITDQFIAKRNAVMDIGPETTSQL